MTELSLPATARSPLPAVLHLTRMELLAFLKHPLTVFWTFVYPLALFLLMNSIFGQRPAAESGTLSYSDWLITGVVALTMVSTALFSFTQPLIDLRSHARLKYFAALPLHSSSFFMGFTASRLLLLTAFCTAFMAILSNVMSHGLGLPWPRCLQLGVFVLAGAMVMIGLGIALAALIQRTATAHAITNSLNVPLIFLSDLFLPVALFPAWMQSLAKLSPLYHFAQALREVYAGQMAAPTYALWVAGMTAAGLLVLFAAARSFSWMPARGA